MLSWNCQHSDKLEGYRKYFEATGQEAHEIRTAPQLSQFVHDIWEAWRYLSSSRSYTMGGAAPIPISEIEAWCRLRRIEHNDDRQRLLTLISSMDITYLEHANRKET